ncbi:accessory gene regulator B family protein [Clostridium sp. YIM B02515]|uniref:Accessory gene regulator B family protein n=1 Tax=Clostridium rhizosphaerae TaxID=2803861 RepID=A0ABS1TDV6_9CLOT|nr:accessory gene regulator B family protein [Clostridium rhizosphaerae]MBL4937548.1 accessory gene regulator B family protein [Clostridium rhizosphaerae]
MEKLTNNIAGKVAAELKLDNDNKEVISYGMFALMHIALSIILIIIFGLIFHVTIEALIVCFTGAILRKYSGGAHASSPGNCAVIGTIICIGQALLISAVIGPVITSSVLIFLGMGTFGVSYYFIYKLAPVDSSAKPIRSKEKKIRMKKGSIFVLCAYIVIVIINVAINIFSRDKRFIVYSLCIYGGVIWQVFTLTRLGHSTVNKIDSFLNNILGIIKRRGLQ